MNSPEIQMPRLLGLSHNEASWRHHGEIKKGNHEKE